MPSKTRMLTLIKDLDWKAIRDDLAEAPKLKAFRDEKGRSWLHLACMVNVAERKLKSSDQLKTVRVLLDAGFGVNDVAWKEGRSWKATPVWHAVARSRSHALVKFLLEQGADPNYSLYTRDTKMLRLLVRHGAVVDDPCFDETPFLGAISNSRFKQAEELLKLGANVNAVDKKGRTALHMMLKKDSDGEHFRMLMKYGPGGDIRDSTGKTPIEIMSRKRDPEFRKMAEQLASA